MKKSAQLSKLLVRQYEKNRDKKSPHLILKTNQITDSEAFSCNYAGGIINLQADSDLAVIYGIHHLNIGLASGHFSEFLGDWRPRFALRPLWIGCDLDVDLESSSHIPVSLRLPKLLCGSEVNGLSGQNGQGQGQRQLDRLCERVLELGYNAIVLGALDNTSRASTANFGHSGSGTIDIQAICTHLHTYGLKVILKPNKPSGRCPLDAIQAASIQQYIKNFLEKVPYFDYLLWEGDFLHPDCFLHPSAAEATQLELVQAEVALVEKALTESKEGEKPPPSLIYYVPSPDLSTAEQQVAWLQELCDRVGNKTIIAFSAVSGEPWSDHQPPHPFWESLRKSPDISSTALMPIINTGAARQGDGLWPTLTLDLSERYLTRCTRHQFAGAITLVNHLPEKGALLDCSLWVCSQMLWKNRSAALLAETWFSAERPDFDYLYFAESLRKVRELAVELSFIRSLRNERHRDLLSQTESRAMADSFLARLRELQILFECSEKKTKKHTHNRGSVVRPRCNDYFSYFARDAIRLVAYFMQCFQVTLPHIRKEEDVWEGFWTKSKQGSTYSASKPVFLETPQRGVPGTVMERIYLEVYPNI